MPPQRCMPGLARLAEDGHGVLSPHHPTPSCYQTSEYKHQRQVFDAKAREWTRRHAMADGPAAAQAQPAAAAPGTATQEAAAKPRHEQQAQGAGAAAPRAAVGEQAKQVVPLRAQATADAPAAVEAEAAASKPVQEQQQQQQGSKKNAGSSAVNQQAGTGQQAVATARTEAQQPVKRPRLALRK